MIPEIPFYIGLIGQVPYLPPGSELADAVIEVMTVHNLAVMANHGQITVAQDFDHVIQNAEFFELKEPGPFCCPADVWTRSPQKR